MLKLLKLRRLASAVAMISVLASPLTAQADHSWGNYHWARQNNPFTIMLGDNVSGAWDGYLGTASTDWTQSEILDTQVVAGQGGKNCKATAGRAEVCNRKYGNNGWLGIAQIWASGNHITQGVVKMNDTYFNQAQYNTPAWRNLVMCQEVGHIFGLDHQDENFNNGNLNTCMDYTNNPATNQHPNAHDYEQLASIYEHLDSTTTVGNWVTARGNATAEENASDWGKAIREDGAGRPDLFVKDFGNGQKILTHVFWTLEHQHNDHH